MKYLGLAPTLGEDLVTKSYTDSLAGSVYLDPDGFYVPVTGAVAGSDSFPTVESDNGIATVGRHHSGAGVYSWSGVDSGTICLVYVRPQKNGTYSTMNLPIWAAAASVTLARMGVYSVAGNGDLTLMSATPNDTTIVTNSYQTNSKALSAPVSLVAGNVYAFALIVVATGAMPEMSGINYSWAEATLNPRLTGRVTAQTDLLSSITAAQIWTTGAGIYMRAS